MNTRITDSMSPMLASMRAKAWSTSCLIAAEAVISPATVKPMTTVRTRPEPGSQARLVIFAITGLAFWAVGTLAACGHLQ